jgi:hypothetical protein
MSQNRSIGPELGSKLLTAKAGDVVDGPTAQGAYMVARVDAVAPAPIADAAHAVVAQNRQFSAQMFQDLGEMARVAARTSVKPTMDPVRARTALGISPEDAAKAQAAGGGAAGKAP